MEASGCDYDHARCRRTGRRSDVSALRDWAVLDYRRKSQLAELSLRRATSTSISSGLSISAQVLYSATAHLQSERRHWRLRTGRRSGHISGRKHGARWRTGIFSHSTYRYRAQVADHMGEPVWHSSHWNS